MAKEKVSQIEIPEFTYFSDLKDNFIDYRRTKEQAVKGQVGFWENEINNLNPKYLEILTTNVANLDAVSSQEFNLEVLEKVQNLTESKSFWAKLKNAKNSLEIWNKWDNLRNYLTSNQSLTVGEVYKLVAVFVQKFDELNPITKSKPSNKLDFNLLNDRQNTQNQAKPRLKPENVLTEIAQTLNHVASLRDLQLDGNDLGSSKGRRYLKKSETEYRRLQLTVAGTVVNVMTLGTTIPVNALISALYNVKSSYELIKNDASEVVDSNETFEIMKKLGSVSEYLVNYEGEISSIDLVELNDLQTQIKALLPRISKPEDRKLLVKSLSRIEALKDKHVESETINHAANLKKDKISLFDFDSASEPAQVLNYYNKAVNKIARFLPRPIRNRGKEFMRNAGDWVGSKTKELRQTAAIVTGKEVIKDTDLASIKTKLQVNAVILFLKSVGLTGAMYGISQILVGSEQTDLLGDIGADFFSSLKRTLGINQIKVPSNSFLAHAIEHHQNGRAINALTEWVNANHTYNINGINKFDAEGASQALDSLRQSGVFNNMRAIDMVNMSPDQIQVLANSFDDPNSKELFLDAFFNQPEFIQSLEKSPTTSKWMASQIDAGSFLLGSTSVLVLLKNLFKNQKNKATQHSEKIHEKVAQGAEMVSTGMTIATAPLLIPIVGGVYTGKTLANEGILGAKSATQALPVTLKQINGQYIQPGINAVIETAGQINQSYIQPRIQKLKELKQSALTKHTESNVEQDGETIAEEILIKTKKDFIIAVKTERNFSLNSLLQEIDQKLSDAEPATKVQIIINFFKSLIEAGIKTELDLTGSLILSKNIGTSAELLGFEYYTSRDKHTLQLKVGDRSFTENLSGLEVLSEFQNITILYPTQSEIQLAQKQKAEKFAAELDPQNIENIEPYSTRQENIFSNQDLISQVKNIESEYVAKFKNAPKGTQTNEKLDFLNAKLYSVLSSEEYVYLANNLLNDPYFGKQGDSVDNRKQLLLQIINSGTDDEKRNLGRVFIEYLRNLLQPNQVRNSILDSISDLTEPVNSQQLDEFKNLAENQIIQIKEEINQLLNKIVYQNGEKTITFSRLCKGLVALSNNNIKSAKSKNSINNILSNLSKNFDRNQLITDMVTILELEQSDYTKSMSVNDIIQLQDRVSKYFNTSAQLFSNLNRAL